MGEVRSAVDATLAALELEDADAAAAELARELAEEIDRARIAERVADHAIRDLDDDITGETEELIRALKAKVSHRDAIVRCGQRLEAVLVQLQATPASRAKAGSAPASFAGGALTALRGGKAG